MTQRPYEPPSHIASVIDFVNDEDRRYFEDHPNAPYYDRRFHPLEVWPLIAPAGAWSVRVFQICPGVRIRVPFREGGQPERAHLRRIRDIRRAVAKMDRNRHQRTKDSVER